MYHKKKGEKMSYGIVGLGRFGYALATELARMGADLLVIDRDEEKVRELREITENAMVVGNLDRKSLMETGIQNCDVGIVCIAEKMDLSILTTLNLVSLGIPKVISKATSPEHGEILEKLGAEVVYPERDMALRLANRLQAARVLDFIELSEQINISKIRVPEKMVERTVESLKLRHHFGLNIIAIQNHGKVMESVQPDYVLSRDDVLIVAGSKEGLIRLSDWAEKN